MGIGFKLNVMCLEYSSRIVSCPHIVNSCNESCFVGSFCVIGLFLSNYLGLYDTIRFL